MNLPKALTPLNPVALADILFRKDSKRIESFLAQSQDKRVAILNAVTPHVKKDLLRRIPMQGLVAILETVDPDEATDMLQLLGKRRRETALHLLSEELKNSLSTLLEFDAKTAAGLMTLDYIHADISENIEGVAEKFRRHEHKTGRPPVILATKDGRLAGFLPGHELGLSGKKELIGKRIKHMSSVSYAASHDEVVHIFRTHPHGKVAVINDNDDVVGIIYSDDILQLLEEQSTSSLYNFAGITQEESVTDSARRKVQNRYRWLIINLATAFLAAFTVGQFDPTDLTKTK